MEEELPIFKKNLEKQPPNSAMAERNIGNTIIIIKESEAINTNITSEIVETNSDLNFLSDAANINVTSLCMTANINAVTLIEPTNAGAATGSGDSNITVSSESDNTNILLSTFKDDLSAILRIVETSSYTIAIKVNLNTNSRVETMNTNENIATKAGNINQISESEIEKSNRTTEKEVDNRKQTAEIGAENNKQTAGFGTTNTYQPFKRGEAINNQTTQSKSKAVNTNQISGGEKKIITQISESIAATVSTFVVETENINQASGVGAATINLTSGSKSDDEKQTSDDEADNTTNISGSREANSKQIFRSGTANINQTFKSEETNTHQPSGSKDLNSNQISGSQENGTNQTSRNGTSNNKEIDEEKSANISERSESKTINTGETYGTFEVNNIEKFLRSSLNFETMSERLAEDIYNIAKIILNNYYAKGSIITVDINTRVGITINMKVITEIRSVRIEIVVPSERRLEDANSNKTSEGGSGNSSGISEMLPTWSERMPIRNQRTLRRYRLRQISDFCRNYNLIIEKVRQNILPVAIELAQELNMLSCTLYDEEVQIFIEELESLFNELCIFQSTIFPLVDTEANGSQLSYNLFRCYLDFGNILDSLNEAFDEWLDYYD